MNVRVVHAIEASKTMEGSTEKSASLANAGKISAIEKMSNCKAGNAKLENSNTWKIYFLTGCCGQHHQNDMFTTCVCSAHLI